MQYVVIEYLEPVSPGNRRIYEPVEGLGPVLCSESEAPDLFAQLGGAPSPYRIVPVAYAVKNGLMDAFNA